MNRKSLLTLAAGFLIATGSAHAQQKCAGSDIANGPFSYTAASPSSATFVGSAATTVGPVHFSVTAPSVANDTNKPDVFPGQGQNPCLGLADAHIHIHEIVKIKDSQGTVLNPPVNVDPASDLFTRITGAFSFTPANTQFAPGSVVPVSVTVSNPNVLAADLGSYLVSMKSHAPGAGIGTGPGSNFALELTGQAPDRIPPTVSINKPAGDQILGVIPVEISAVDPAPGSGVASLSGSVSSTGGAVSNQVLTLTVAGLPQGSGAAGTPVVATTNFTPFGGTGTAGTSLAQAFTSANRSGIGTYLLNARATDGAGNTGFGNAIFKVKYDLNFTQTAVANGCPGGNANNPQFGPCNAMYQLKAKRSAATSDGAFMFDTTVVLKLVRTSDNVVVATHICASANCNGGAIHGNVQIDETNKLYKSHFRHSDLDADPNTAGQQVPATLNEYRLDVYFMDVDGNLMLQGSSQPLMF